MALEEPMHPELPKLPVPDVKKTLARYLEAIRSFTPDEQYEKTSKIVQQFVENQNDVDAIETALKARHDKFENWAYDWWLDDMYLNNMVPLPVVSNPAWVFPRQKFDTRNDMYIYLAKIVHGISTFKQDLERGVLKFEEGGKLCMKQYERLLTSYRIPGPGKDQLKTWDARVVNLDEHILVMAKHYTYKMYIKQGGEWLSEETVVQLLIRIHDDATARPLLPQDESVPLLTSDARQNWANARTELLRDDANKKNFEAIEGCLFVVCLDEMSHNCSDKDRSQKDLFKKVLTAGGAKASAANRWFDKTIQIIVSEDGQSGMNYEHTTSEGVAVVTMVLEILKKMQKSQVETKDEIKEASKLIDDVTKLFIRLDWTLKPDVKIAMAKAAESMNKLDEDTDIEVFRYNKFGKGLMKKCNCSPDSFVQMAMQLTYFRLHQCLCATYESASLRRFRQGRVDSIRASHTSALAWVRTMDDPAKRIGEKRNLFLEAIKTQTRIMKENIFGEGLDIPFLGIRMTCQELWPNKTLEIFQDANFKIANHFKLTTSQVPIGLDDSYMGYGAVVPDGYGVSYNLQEEFIIFCIASFYSCQETSSIRFAHVLQQSLADISDLFSGKVEE